MDIFFIVLSDPDGLRIYNPEFSSLSLYKSGKDLHDLYKWKTQT
jgi:sensor histidine kinase regulating citrate/malate metabolism